MEHIAGAYAEAADYWYRAGFDTVLVHGARVDIQPVSVASRQYAD